MQQQRRWRRIARQQIGVSLEQQRRRRYLWQWQLAEQANVSQASVSNYETGKRDPLFSIIEPMMGVLGISFAELLPDTLVVVVRDPQLQEAVRLLSAAPERIEAVLRAAEDRAATAPD